MRFGRIAAAGITAAAMALGTGAVATAETGPSGFEEHLFNGSSTSAQAFENWFAGGEFVEPEVQTMDLRHLKVNEFQTAEPGEVIYKDDQGRFWVKRDTAIK